MTLLQGLKDPVLPTLHSNCSPIFVECGENKLKENITTDELNMIRENQVEKSEDSGICTNVLISDKYVLTVAHCLEDSAL